MVARYTTQRGETARDVARKFTGDPERYLDLMPVNPHIQTVTGQMGRPEFDSRDWHDGIALKLPEKWTDDGQIHGPAGHVGAPYAAKKLKKWLPSPAQYGKKWSPRPEYGRKLNPWWISQKPYGYVGEDPEQPDWFWGDYEDDDAPENADAAKKASGHCTQYLPKGNGEVKSYLFNVRSGDNLIEITKTWLDTDDVYGRGLYTWSELAAVNRNRLYSDCSTLQPSAGGNIYIPADWPECPEKWADRRRNPDGTVYTGGEPPAPPGPGPNGGNGIDRVGASEDGEGSTVLLVLAAAAAIGGGILLYNSQKKKR